MRGRSDLITAKMAHFDISKASMERATVKKAATTSSQCHVQLFFRTLLPLNRETQLSHKFFFSGVMRTDREFKAQKNPIIKNSCVSPFDTVLTPPCIPAN